MTRFLANSELDRELATLGGWYRSGHELRRVYPAGSHREAMEFVAAATTAVGGAPHEPVYGVQVHGRFVYVTLYCPDYGGVTDSDVGLARTLDSLAREQLRPPAPAGEREPVIAPYADVMGSPEPDEERTDVMGGPEADGEHGVLGGPEPAEERTDVLGGGKGDGEHGVFGGPEPDEERTDVMGGPRHDRGTGA